MFAGHAYEGGGLQVIHMLRHIARVRADTASHSGVWNGHPHYKSAVPDPGLESQAHRKIMLFNQQKEEALREERAQEERALAAREERNQAGARARALRRPWCCALMPALSSCAGR